MNRRELLKTGLLAVGGAVALSGCDAEKKSENIENPNIIPEQTDTYKFSAPLPFNFDIIDELADFNKDLKKSKITTLYNNIPMPLAKDFNFWVQINRGENNTIKTYEDFAKYVDYAKKKGFDFCYLMNSIKPISKNDFPRFEKKFYKILDFISSIGIRKIKFSNTQVATLINEYKHKFELSSSTTAEYHNITQYQNLITNYPNINFIDMAVDENQNFPLLRNMKKMFPNVTLELMVNEMCLKGCPARISHGADYDFKVFDCMHVSEKKGMVQHFFKTGVIYPWNLEYYSAIGINNFKIVPIMNEGLRANYKNLTPLKTYITCVEKGVGDMSAYEFFNDMYFTLIRPPKDLSLAQLIQYFPRMEKFAQYGDKCAAHCGIDCNYCPQCARKVESAILSA